MDKVSFSIPIGNICGFLGLNGAGKSTTLRIILGLIKKYKGEVYILGNNISTTSYKVFHNVGAMIESPELYTDMSAKENLQLYSDIYKIPRKSVDYTLDLVGLGDTGGKKVKYFSMGMKQRLGWAQAILNNPSVLILDEPTNGLDPTGVLDFRNFLHTINQKEGTTILFSSHSLYDISEVCNQVIVLNKGKVHFESKIFGDKSIMSLEKIFKGLEGEYQNVYVNKV